MVCDLKSVQFVAAIELEFFINYNTVTIRRSSRNEKV